MSILPKKKSPRNLVSTVPTPRIGKPSPRSTGSSPSPRRGNSPPRGRSPSHSNGRSPSPTSMGLSCQYESYESYAQMGNHLKEISDKLTDRMVNNVTKISKLQEDLNNSLGVCKQLKN